MIDMKQLSVVAGEVTLLPPVSVAVPPGTALIVRGRNGTGKSTLLRVLAGSQAPSSGSATIADAPIDDRDRSFRARVASMIGMPPIAPDLTVRDHVLLVATTWWARGKDAERVTDALLAELRLEPLGARFAHELSSGQTQMFGLALVLARPFDILILDEPEQRLDPEHVAALTALLRARSEAGATLVVATHSRALADGLGGRTLDLGLAA